MPFGWLFLLQFWAADDNVYSLGEIYDCMKMAKFHCGLIQAFTFLVSDSYIPSIRHSLPSAATSSYLSSRRSRTKRKRPSRSAESVRVGISSGEIPPIGTQMLINFGRQLPMVGILNSRIVYFHRLHK